MCPEAEEPTPELGDAGVHWLPLEQLEHMEGPWRTTDGEVLVSLADRGSEGPGFPAQLWRLTVEWSSGPLIVCTMYEALQYGDPPTRGMPWRLGYCRGRAVVSSEEPALATRVILLRVPKQEYLRLVLGTELDVDIYQVQ